MNLLIPERPKVNCMQLKQRLKRVTSFLLASFLVTSTHLYAADTPCGSPLVEIRNGFKVAYSACTVNTLYTDSYVRIQQQSATTADCGASTGGYPSSPATNNRGGWVSQTCGNWNVSSQRCGTFGDSSTILASGGDYCVAVRTDQGEEVIVHAVWDGTTFNSVGALYRDILEVTGNNVSITDGDSSPQTADNTDFGNVAINSTKTHTFVVTNNSSQSITLNSITVSAYSSQVKSTSFLDKLLASFDPISVAWAAVLAPEFTKVSPNGAVTITAGASQNFEIKFAPTTLGLQQAQIDLEAGSGTTHSFVVQGTGVGPAPVATNNTNTFTVNEDAAAFTINSAALLTNDTGDDLSVLNVTAVTGGTVVLSPDRATITFTPAANFNGTAKFTYELVDGIGRTATAEVSGTITAINDLPSLKPNPPNTAGTTEEDKPLAIPVANLLANFTDPDTGDTLSLDAVGSPQNGTVTRANGTVTFTPTPDFVGTASFDYTVKDSSGAMTTATFKITVTDVDDSLVIKSNGQTITSGDNTPSLADCTDFGSLKIAGETKVCTYTIDNPNTSPINALISLSETPTATTSLWGTFEQALNFLNPIQLAWAVGAGDFIAATNTITVPANGTASFSISFDPSAAGLREALVNLTVSGSNAYSFRIAGTGLSASPPVVVQSIAPITVTDSTTNTVLNLGTNFSDPDNKTLTLSIVGNTNSSLVTPTLSGNTLTLAYAPNQTGTATITIRATAADGEFVETSFTVTVNSSTPIPLISPLGLLLIVLGLAWLGSHRRRSA